MIPSRSRTTNELVIVDAHMYKLRLLNDSDENDDSFIEDLIGLVVIGDIPRLYMSDESGDEAKDQPRTRKPNKRRNFNESHRRFHRYYF